MARKAWRDFGENVVRRISCSGHKNYIGLTDQAVGLKSLNKDMRILDLSADLGGRIRKTIEEFGVYITGLEPDPQIAERGMQISVKEGKGKHAVISRYDPNNFHGAQKI
jgi:hypothetical protein